MPSLPQRQNTQLYRKYMQSLLTTYKNRQDLKLFTEILLTSGTAIIFILFAIKPTLTTISDLIAERGVKKGTLTTMDNKISALQKAEIIFNSESQRLKLLELAVPDQPIPEDFIRQIEGLAQKNSVLLLGLSLSETNITRSLAQPQAVSEEIEVTLKVGGNYPSLLAFLTDLEAMRRPLLTHFGTIALADPSEPAEITLSITGVIPFYRQPAANSTQL